MFNVPIRIEVYFEICSEYTVESRDGRVPTKVRVYLKKSVKGLPRVVEDLDGGMNT